MLIEKTDNYVVFQSFASRTENEYEVYDLNENMLGYFVERSDNDYEVYSLDCAEFGYISHEEFNQIDYVDDFADAVNLIVSSAYAE
jgi:hypothetical protein